MKKDPFRVAPTVAQYVPWIVPEQLAGRSFSRSSSPMSSFPDRSESESGSGKSEGGFFTNDSLKSASEPNHSSSLETSTDEGMPASEIATESSSNQGKLTTDSNSRPDSLMDPNTSDLPKAEVAKSDPSLPFSLDAQRSEQSDRTLQLFQNIENSFSAMANNPDDASIAKFFVEVDRIFETSDSTPSNLPLALQFEAFESKLQTARNAPWLKKLVGYSRTRLPKDSSVLGMSYVDVFELKERETIDSASALAAFSETHEVWLPSDRTREPIRSMRVIAPKAKGPTDNSSDPSRFLLLGRIERFDDSNANAFIVYSVVRL